ncbi:hypothetical protein IL306_004443 [Fusarium sp. DS 682]|nr:hypothetical protein IL306_004443 [Fusarium sp. DS 682]
MSPPDLYGREILGDAQWTKVSRKLVSVEVLQRLGVRYEARPDYVAILGVLSKEQVANLVRESEATVFSDPSGLYHRERDAAAQEWPGLLDSEDMPLVPIPLLDSPNFDSPDPSALRKALDDYLNACKEKRNARRGAGMKQDKRRQRRRVQMRLRSTKEKPDLSGFQQSIRAYDKGGPGGLGVVGIGSSAVSLLSVLSEAASAI